MKQRRISAAVVAALAAVALGVPPASAAQSKSKIKVEFENEGVIAEASGKGIASIKELRSKMTVSFKKLAPSTTYAFVVGGVPEATFTTSSSGSGKVRFFMPPKPGQDALDFDPRGQQITVATGGSDVLQVVFSGAGEPAGIQVDERVPLAPSPLAAGGKAEARFRTKKGRQQLNVEVQGVPAGSYDLFVDGVLRAAIVVDSSGKGEVEFDSEAEPGTLPLDFDPRGLAVDVSQGANVFFSADLAAPGQGVTACTFSASESPLGSTAADPDGSAKARLRTRDDCERDFRVEAEDVPVGDYDLLVGGVPRGTITVVDTGLAIEGELEFDTDPDDPGELLLDFDPIGQVVEIAQGATIFFSSVFDGSGGGSSLCAPAESELPLLNTGPDPDAKGKARVRTKDDCGEDFRVEIEDLPLGDYDLLVGGVLRGTITVVDTGLELEGEIEFDTDPDEPGELPLTFDPRGRLIEVVQGGTVFLSRVLADDGGGGGPTTCTPSDVEPDLVNVGPDGNAKGKARVRVRDDCDLDFRVEVENLPLGSYDLRVAGVSRGTIVVMLVAGEELGHIEFDTDPDEPGEILLTFDPRGALIEIVQGATVFLDLAFPAG